MRLLRYKVILILMLGFEWVEKRTNSYFRKLYSKDTIKLQQEMVSKDYYTR